MLPFPRPLVVIRARNVSRAYLPLFTELLFMLRTRHFCFYNTIIRYFVQSSYFYRDDDVYFNYYIMLLETHLTIDFVTYLYVLLHSTPSLHELRTVVFKRISY